MFPECSGTSPLCPYAEVAGDRIWGIPNATPDGGDPDASGGRASLSGMRQQGMEQREVLQGDHHELPGMSVQVSDPDTRDRSRTVIPSYQTSI